MVGSKFKVRFDMGFKTWPNKNKSVIPKNKVSDGGRGRQAVSLEDSLHPQSEHRSKHLDGALKQ